MKLMNKVMLGPKSILLKIAYHILLIEGILILDFFVPTSLAACYIFPIILSALQFSSAVSFAVAATSIIFAILGDELYHTTNELILRYIIISASFFFISWAASSTRSYFDELMESNKQLEIEKEKEKELRKEIIDTLSIAVEAKDKYTFGHIYQVVKLSKKIAQEMNLDEEEIEFIYKAALLHDIGKISIEESILQKPMELTPNERKKIEKHPEKGAEFIARIPSLKSIVPAIKHHHERWDGYGYPYGLKGRNIPFAARIIAVADSFEAMTSDRAYRKGISPKEAVKEIERNKGKQFDPDIVEVFLRVMEKEGVITKKDLLLSKVNNAHAICFYDSKNTTGRKAYELITGLMDRNWKLMTCVNEVERHALKNKFKEEILEGKVNLPTASEYIWYGESPQTDLANNLHKMLQENSK